MTGSSVVRAAERAAEETKRQLFPARFNRWFALGFVAYLDQCGRGGGGGFNVPSPGNHGSGTSEAKDTLDQALAFIASHPLLIAAIVALTIALVLALSALIAWVRSRGTFMYIDNVATGRADVVRPWHEHAEHASSYFAWSFSFGIAMLVVVLMLLATIGWSIVLLVRHGASAGPIAVLGICLLVFFCLIVVGALFSVAMRDFVAPLQWFEGLGCGPALRLMWGLVKTHPTVFLAYLGLKMAFSFAAAILIMLVGCLVCCFTCISCGLLPIIQTVLQPVFYFERRWSLELLMEMGYSVPGGAGTGLPPPPPQPTMPFRTGGPTDTLAVLRPLVPGAPPLGEGRGDA